MILRKLNAFGFKSFADKTEIEFGSGITAVVGPNGCGKSNVVDAIRWVFGEQKASALRSTSMQDVIFSGTQARKPLNMAEVTLTIENNQKILPIEYNEVAITRRVFRSGESEYRINKVVCRLRDIHNLFLDTGIGSNAYTTIENKMIDAILSDKAEERRILFEEAAGISKYKQRRKESLRKLEYTRQDLLRINDKVQDKQRDVNVLARQVEKAKKYRKWHDELKRLEIGYENKHYTRLKNEMEGRGKSLQELESEYETRKASIASDESRLESMNMAMTEKENEVAIASRKVGDVQEKIIEIDKDISISEENLRHITENIGRFEEETASMQQSIREKQELREKIEKSIIEYETRLLKHQEELEAIKEELSHFDAALAEKRRTADQLSQEHINIINTIADQKNRIGMIQSTMKNSLDLRDRNEREISILTSQQDECNEKLDECKHQLEEATEEHRHLLSSRETLINRIEKEDEKYQELFSQEKQLEAQIDASKSQLDFLRGLDEQMEGYEGGVRSLLKHDIEGKVGSVADVVSVEDEAMVGIVDRVLGAELQTVVFEQDQSMQTAREVLKSQDSGTARMASINRMQQKMPPAFKGVNGYAFPLRSKITTDEKYAYLADHLFNSIYVAPSEEEALRLALECEEPLTFATSTGMICLSNGTVISGSAPKEQAGILMRKQQIDALPVKIEKLRKKYQHIISEKDKCIMTRDEAKVALAGVNEKLSAGQRHQQEHETNLKHYHRQLDTVSDKLFAIRRECTEASEQISELESKVGLASEELNKLTARSSELEQEAESARGAVVAMGTERDEINNRLTNAQLRIQGDTHTISQNKQDVLNLTNDIEGIEKRILKLTEDRQRSTTYIDDLQVRVAALQEELEKHKLSRREREEDHAAIREQYNAILIQMEEIRKKVKTDQQATHELSSTIFTLKNEQTRAEEQMRSIREKIFDAYKIDLASPSDDIAEIEHEDAEARDTMRMYKERLGRLSGQVNMAAPEEYEERARELAEMIAQRDDLQQAVDDLEKAIKKLNKEARIKFSETFEQVRRNFTEMFTLLFEGGEAHLTLEENIDPLEAPISINARPAGKKMRGVQLLSGGERALTAISLLFALYMVKPSAYCILDELDAPLDDANIGRFVSILRRFAEKTQFIIITHNKRTMEASDLLYGVTQQEKGVSTLVSVRLEEAMRHAA
ncbi:MAG: chromosome segregation protein SMC [Chitinivibrionales bacterium]|nr:chromosome segregation protein SMC [Chitinivibrionales bacterium]